jgi:protein-L-isoaspartate(D-aspartate) O-methyltransferase
MFGKKSMSDLERAVQAVNRLDFLPPEQRDRVRVDGPLPIGFGQTISQPSLVEEMTRELDPTNSSKVLEIGTGSGYQTAILAELAATVYTIERIPELARDARERLDALGYRNIEFRIGDGALGWPEAAPFDRIMVTAAPDEVPTALIQQLAPGGRMVIPVGADREHQVLECFTKDQEGRVEHRELFGVRFVPLVTGAE